MRIGITGHRGLSQHVENQVRALLWEVASAHDPADLVGVSCIADGPDAWFAQAVLDHGGSLEVVIPAEQYREGLPPGTTPSTTSCCTEPPRYTAPASPHPTRRHTW